MLSGATDPESIFDAGYADLQLFFLQRKSDDTASRLD